MMRAAAMARAATLLKKAATDAARLAVADQAYNEGDLRVASRLYMSLARAKSPAAMEAKQRLTQMGEDARRKLEEIDSRLGEDGVRLRRNFDDLPVNLQEKPYDKI